MISPPTALARCTAIALFPTPVGPTRATKKGRRSAEGVETRAVEADEMSTGDIIL
jgi:hypothetical protein